MKDGSRHFTALPQTRLWQEVRDHVHLLPGARVTAFLYDNVTEASIDFAWRGQSFTIIDQIGGYRFIASPGMPQLHIKGCSLSLRQALESFAKVKGVVSAIAGRKVQLKT